MENAFGLGTEIGAMGAAGAVGAVGATGATGADTGAGATAGVETGAGAGAGAETGSGALGSSTGLEEGSTSEEIDERKPRVPRFVFARRVPRAL